MSDWKKEKLGKYIKIKHGFAFPGSGITQEETTYILVTPGNFNIGGGFKFDKFKYFNGTVPEDYIFQGSEIIVTMTDLSQETDTLGFSAKVPHSSKKKYLHNQRVGLVNFLNNELHPDYCYWLMRTRDYQESIVNSASGTSIMHTSPDRIANYDALIPPLPEQQAIAEVLSSLDDKIDLLHRNNKTLEEMAETLFRQWFVSCENLETSKMMKIEEVAEFQNGYSFKSSEFVDEGPDTIEVMKMGHISPEGGLRSSPKKDFVKKTNKLSKWTLNKRDIVLCMTDMKDNVVVLGVPALVDMDNKYVLNQRVGRIFLKPDSPILNILILFMQMRESSFIHELQAKGNSGVQVNLGTDTIRESQILVPDSKQQNNILPHLQSLTNKLELNKVQISQLEKIRDTLLPKLMSGQVRVKIDK